ncbi:MAG: hypothetical protein HKN18_10070 [Silicimonas sp.]|nr:hypothetical protein [Silicimonas sp.]
MAYLLVSFVAALVMAVTVYAETSSFLWAFVAYVLAGFGVLMTGLVTAMLTPQSNGELKPNQG